MKFFPIHVLDYHTQQKQDVNLISIVSYIYIHVASYLHVYGHGNICLYT